MGKRQQHSVKGVPTQAPGTIGFRLDERTRAVLAERADRMGLSPHELARNCLYEKLEEQNRGLALEDAVDVLRSEIHQLRVDIATIAEALLVTAGEQEPKAAREWIDANLRRKP